VGVIVQDGEGPDASACRSAVHGDADHMLVAGERACFDVTLDAAGVRADNIRSSGSCCPPGEGPEGGTVACLQAGRSVR
jgi:cold shock CspA family protein